MNFTIASNPIKATFDAYGRLVDFTNTDCAKNSILAEAPKTPFRMTIELGENKEVTICQDAVKPKVFKQSNAIEFTYETLEFFDGQHQLTIPIRLSLKATIVDDTLVFDASINNSSQARILDFTYPVVGKIADLGTGLPPALLMPSQAGFRIQNAPAWLAGMWEHRENSPNTATHVYPGEASMQWQALADEQSSLFLTAHDCDFYPNEITQRGEANRKIVTLEFTRIICLEPGRKFNSPEAVLHFYKGTWHKGAKNYANWMNQYRPQHVKPDWIRKMAGYFLVINKQQYGYEMWPYHTLPKLYELAKAHGCDTLGLFGWYHTGHDNQYPDLEVSPTLGGTQTLKENIKKVQNEGGHVTLYYQGHLIDETSDYYRNKDGKRICVKNIWGSPYVEFYNKSHQSDFLKNFSRKMFAIACPSTPEWRDLMLRRQDWLADLGPDGCLYDQIGGIIPYVCFDKSHGHKQDNPALANTGGRRQLLNSLQTHAKHINPNFAFMSEHINDIYSGYLDAVHSCGVTPSAPGDYADAHDNPHVVRRINYPALFKYCFPNDVITTRNPNPHISTRLSNYALAFGFRPEMEIRYQADCDDVLSDKYKQTREYALKVASLRQQFANELLLGTFVDNEEIESCDPHIIATSFVNQNTMAVVLWNDTPNQYKLDNFKAKEGWTIDAIATPGGSLDKLPATIEPGQLIVARYTR